MKKQLVFGYLILVLAASVSAQGAPTPKSGDLGLGASVSTTANTALVFYHLSDSLMLAPQVGFFYRNFADTSGGVTTDYPGTWFDVGLGLYWVLRPFESLSFQVGPSLEIASESYQNEGSTDNLQFTYWTLNLNARVLAMITKNLGVFTTFGVYYYSQDTKDTTTAVDSTKTGLGVQSLSLGVAYYFK